jgi:predicted RNA-binding Zn-ribbon protein involved in translation (DUF1610 family)
MDQASKMICPACGAEMNHHADKIDYAAGFEGETAVDPVLGGVIQEVYTCPECGRIEMRPA